MARIRTIKPEFPQSESLGRVSRDARLLFVNLFTICDDYGRSRANSRALASLLFPYDDDAPKLITEWLDELEREGCIRRYEIDGNHYLDIPKWLQHQKVDHPSKPQIPEFLEGFEKSREDMRNPRRGPGPGPVPVPVKDQERIDGAPAPEPPSAPGTIIPLEFDRTPEGEAVRQWNVFAAERNLAQVQRLTEPRRRKLRQRLTECGGDWPTVLAKVRDSPFMLGENREGWTLDFDFLLQQKSFTKLMEGGYAKRASGTGRNANTAEGDSKAIIGALADELGAGNGDPPLAEPRHVAG